MIDEMIDYERDYDMIISVQNAERAVDASEQGGCGTPTAYVDACVNWHSQ